MSSSTVNSTAATTAASAATTAASAAQRDGGQLSDGLSSLVLSKKYLSCARPPHVYKLDRGVAGDYAAVAAAEYCSWPPVAAAGWGGVAPAPPAAAAVHARYEPSDDVFTPLVFEEIHPPTPQHQQQPEPEQPTAWLHRQQPAHHPHDGHHDHLQRLHRVQQPAYHHRRDVHRPSDNRNHFQTTRRPLQHLPPPAQSVVAKSAASAAIDHLQFDDCGDNNTGNNNKPGDLSWLVNFQVASIFEPSATAGGCAAGNRAEPWPREPDSTAKLQKKKAAATKTATDLQKPSNKVNRKPYRMPPSRLDKANKPGYTYTEMIHQALMEKKELPVAEIYQWISNHFPYFREDDERWKNSVRHNLSINPNFRKGRKSQGAGHYWRLCNTEESLGHREYSAITEDNTSSSPPESSELEQACKYLEGELQRTDSLEDVKLHASIDSELENEIYTNSFLISNPSKYVNEQINISNNSDFHSYSENLLEESIDFQYYNL